MGRLEGQVALVTGAGGGIGRAVCARYLEEGARVLALDIDVTAAEAAIAGGSGEGAAALRCDVGDSDAVRAAVAEAVARFGRLTVLCSIAGGSTPKDGPVTDAPEEEFWRAIRLDLFGTFLVCRHGVPELIRAGGGSVINFASMVALIGLPGLDCYTAAKGGIVSLTRSMAVEYGRQNVRVNAIAPGVTMTPRIRQRWESGGIDPATIERHLLGPVEPEDVAEAAVFLAAPESRKITGQILPVESGSTIG